jgi:hypothetical protein
VDVFTARLSTIDDRNVLKKKVIKQLPLIDFFFYNPFAELSNSWGPDTFSLDEAIPSIPGIPDRFSFHPQLQPIQKIIECRAILAVIWSLLFEVLNPSENHVIFPSLERSNDKLGSLSEPVKDALFNALRLLDVSLGYITQLSSTETSDKTSSITNTVHPLSYPIGKNTNIDILETLFINPVEGKPSIASMLYQFYVDNYSLDKFEFNNLNLGVFSSSPLLAALLSRVLHRLRNLMYDKKKKKTEKGVEWFKQISEKSEEGEKKNDTNKENENGEKCAYCRCVIREGMDKGLISFITYTPILQAIHTGGCMHQSEVEKEDKKDWWDLQMTAEKARREAIPPPKKKKNDDYDFSVDSSDDSSDDDSDVKKIEINSQMYRYGPIPPDKSGKIRLGFCEVFFFYLVTFLFSKNGEQRNEIFGKVDLYRDVFEIPEKSPMSFGLSFYLFLFFIDKFQKD